MQYAQIEPETMLVKVLIDIRDDNLTQALSGVEEILRSYPNFRLAQLIHGDLLLARSRPLREFGEASNASKEQIQDLRDEARVRLARYQAKLPGDRIPKYVIELNRDQKYAFVVDTRQSRLYVYENNNGTARYVADYYVSSGKNGVEKVKEGDKKTPLGVYHVTASLPRAKLPDLYGIGAFPISYPNEWDHRQGRAGTGIWLHGTPSDTYSRAPRASDGCVVLTNSDLEKISKELRIGVTPVIITDGIEWVKPGDLTAVRDQINKNLENWRRDWESRNTDTYLRHYAAGFSSNSQDLAAWSREKRAVNASKSWIKVNVDRVSVFLYPGRNDLAVVSFDQDYASNNLNNQMRKRQYWINEQGAWHIIYEGSA